MSQLSPLDRWTILYAVFAQLSFLWRWPASAAVASHFPVVHAGLVGLAIMAPRLRRHGPLGEFWASFYPLILVLALYTEIGQLNRALGFSQDPTVQSWEAGLFGDQPSRDWIRAWPWPWLSWLLHLGYLSCYVILSASPLGLWFLGQRAGARDTVCLVMVAFYLCYAVFLLFPVAGPRYLFPLAQNPATAIPVATFTQAAETERPGDRLPSSTWRFAVASLTAWRFSRPRGRSWFRPVLLALGTVYGRSTTRSRPCGAAMAAAVWLSPASPLASTATFSRASLTLARPGC